MNTSAIMLLPPKFTLNFLPNTSFWHPVKLLSLIWKDEILLT